MKLATYPPAKAGREFWQGEGVTTFRSLWVPRRHDPGTFRKNHVSMATIPSIEAHLVKLHECLRLPAKTRIKTEDRRGLSDLGLSLEKHHELVQHYMGEILRSFDLDEQASTFAFQHLVDWANFYKAVQLRTWTGRASHEQVVWHLAANVHAPALGRYLAYWALDSALGHGMPGGQFWFLPTVDASTGQVTEPIPKVLDWLLDLYGAPAAQMSEALGADGPSEKADSFARNLSNWRKNPPYARTIQEMFSDEFDRNPETRFRGTFEVDSSLPLVKRAAVARSFVKAKNLDPDLLRDEIPMTGPGRIESVLQDEAPPEETERFIQLLLDRYSRPSARVIRQRFTIALMCQQAYRELCILFGAKHDDGDRSRNKVLQLAAILSRSYNLTIEARNVAGEAGEDAEDLYFEGRLLPWERLGQFMSVLPSRKGRAAPDVGDHLTRIFMGLDPQAGLQDLIPLSAEQLESVARSTKSGLEKELEEIDRYKALKERVLRTSAWRVMQGEASFNAVHRLIGDPEVSNQARAAAAQRMRELASTPDEMLQAILAQLNMLLDCTPGQRPKDVERLVAFLLEEAKSNPAATEWQAPILAFEAKHLLAQNEWASALAKFREALKACSQASFGPLRGEVARDAWSVALARDRLQADQENFYRNMLDYGEIEGPQAQVTMEDVALQVADYFWEDLYKPYPSTPRLPPPVQVQAQPALEKAFELIAASDWDELKSWFKANGSLHRARLKEVRGDTVLTLWLKTLSQRILPDEFRLRLLNAIEMLLEAWPKQANLADFKGQTPLILAADSGLERVVDALLKCPDINVNSQDYLGRTALHAAVTGNSTACARMLLEKQPDMTLATFGEGQTALHTAVRMGSLKAVTLIKEEFPFLTEHRNAVGRTPAEQCEESLQDYDTYAKVLTTHGRVPPTHDALLLIHGALTASS